MVKEATLMYVERVKKIAKRHTYRHGNRKITIAKLDRLCCGEAKKS